MGNGHRHGGGVTHGGSSSISTQPVVHIERIKVDGSFSIYENSDTLPITPAQHSAGATGPAWGTFAGWGQGPTVREAEWARGRERHRACLQRNQPISLSVTLRVAPNTGRALSGRLEGTLSIDGDASAFPGAVGASFSFPPNAREVTVRIAFNNGRTPNEIGRVELRVAWSSTSTTYRFDTPETSQRVYLLHGTPIRPDYDSAAPNDNGSAGQAGHDTVSGTQQRLDKLMSMLGRHFRHPDATAADINQLLWLLHSGINNSSPPYFDAGHAERISDDGDSHEMPAGAHDPHEYNVKDNWLMWARPRRRPGWTRDDGPRKMYWNDGSCIGHVQLLKTMVGSVGLFARRAWVLPTTTVVPSVGQASPYAAVPWRGTRPVGRNVAATEDDIHVLGNLVDNHNHALYRQWWVFPHPIRPGDAILARPVLIEPGGHYGENENFEACLKTPNGHFLPGGYPIESIRTAGATPGADRMGERFVTDKGFSSAQDVLRWWANTGRPGGFVRFVLWCGLERVQLPNNGIRTDFFYFDREGAPIQRSEFGTARARQRNLPVPGGDP